MPAIRRMGFSLLLKVNSRMTSSRRVRWGILGPGQIAKAFAHGLRCVPEAELVAVASRDQGRAEAFGAAWGLNPQACYGAYEQLLADRQVDAVYIAVPHPGHPWLAIAAAQAGKHILCEKPAALNAFQVMAMLEAARQHGVFFMEAFMYRCNPQTAKLIELIREGAIGQVRMIRAAFGYGGGETIQPTSRVYDPALGGGGILDVGCYPVSLARLVAGAAEGLPFADPIRVRAAGHLGETGVDEWAAATLQFSSGIVAEVATAIRAPLENHAAIFGSAGRIILPQPWMAAREEAVDGSILLQRGSEEELIPVPAPMTSFAYEIELATQAILAGQKEAPAPAMSWLDTLGNHRTLDAWREEIELVYPDETPANRRPVHGRPLAKRTPSPMRYGRVPGLDRDISKLIMGCDNQTTFAQGAVIWDAWFEAGGNAFDTAHIYGGGLMEKLLGEWIQSRGVAEEVLVTVKGAHTPHCTPEALAQQLAISLERLQLDHAPLYIMHRDNTQVPVSEFIDALNEQVRAGRIGVFGGSNWTLERFEQANAYARRTHQQGMSVLNNNLSLAAMVRPVWEGCVSSSDPATRAFLAQSGTAHFAWSSQARGYFLPEDVRATLGLGDSAGDVCFESEANRERRRRAYELAEKKGVSPLNIAAAWVLNQPFPSFALIGPRTLTELATTLPCLDLELSPQELAWLTLDTATLAN